MCQLYDKTVKSTPTLCQGHQMPNTLLDSDANWLIPEHSVHDQNRLTYLTFTVNIQLGEEMIKRKL
jgi:UDP-N-acetylmuramyl tripeptide synthase